MKVLLTGTSFRLEYGGPAVSVARLASALAEEGIDVGLWAPDRTAKRVAPYAGVTRYDGSLGEAVRSFGTADVIHDNGIWMPHNHRISVIARRGGVPRVVSVRGMLEPWAIEHKAFKKRVAWKLYQRRDLVGASALHAATEFEAATLRKLGLCNPIHVIPNGVDIPPFEGHPMRANASPRKALFLGRIYPVKGLPMLVEAWSRVRPEGWILEIVGPDEKGHRLEVERRIREMSLTGIIRVLDAADTLRKGDLFRSAELFVLPSHSESFGMAIGEALAHAVPVLTTTATPWHDLEEHGCGWTVSPTPDRLAEGLALATSASSERLHEMGLSGRAFVERTYGWNRLARKMIDAYASLRNTMAMGR